MTRYTYAAQVYVEDGAFGIVFPDLPGCVSVADSGDQIAEMATEALSLHIEGMLEDMDPLPNPTSVDRLERDTDGNWVTTLLVTAAPEPASERVNVILPKGLLRQIERFTTARGMNRSAMLSLAARHYLDTAS
jgi:predicted RNase H-like HicB family nuclease